MWILTELSKWTESTSSLLAPWHAPASLKVAYLWEAKAKVIQRPQKGEGTVSISYSLCKHTLDQVHPTFCVQRIDRSLSLIKNHRSLGITFVVVAQSFSHVRLFVTPWITACQAPLSFTISQSLLKFMSFESTICYLTISSSVIPFSFCLESFPASGFFQWVSSSYKVAKVLDLRHQPFQWLLRIDFL